MSESLVIPVELASGAKVALRVTAGQPEAVHVNGNTLDNRLENLRYPNEEDLRELCEQYPEVNFHG